jgi:hypothetical protein
MDEIFRIYLGWGIYISKLKRERCVLGQAYGKKGLKKGFKPLFPNFQQLWNQGAKIK